MIVFAATTPAIDKLFVVEELRPGAIHRPSDFMQVAGGKALNAARAAARLGAAVHVVALASGASGRWIADELAREQVSASFVWGEGATRSALSVWDRSTGLLTEFYEAAPAISVRTWEAFERAVIGALPEARWLAIAGSLVPGAPDDGYAQLVEAARAAGTDAAIDARGGGLASALGAGPRLVKVNAHEAGEALGREPPTNEADLREWALEAAGALRARGGGAAPAVAITCGTAGIVLLDEAGGGWLGTLDVRGPFPVGSGDSVLGALLAAAPRAPVSAQSLKLALGAGAANAMAQGPGRFDVTLARRLVDRAVVTPVAPG